MNPMLSASKITLLPLLLVATVVTKTPGHGLQLKSLQRAELECRQYLSLSAHLDNLRQCDLLVLRSWNATSSSLFPLPFSRHFLPDGDDLDYLERTQTCMACSSSSPSNIWQCYQHQYGTATGAPQLVPATGVLMMNALLQCASMLQIDQWKIPSYLSSSYCEDSAEYRCLMRCYLIRLGLFDVDKGGCCSSEEPNFGRLFVQCGGYGHNETMINENARGCVGELRSTKGCDRCTLATRIATECYPRHLTVFVRTAAATGGYFADE